MAYPILTAQDLLNSRVPSPTNLSNYANPSPVPGVSRPVYNTSLYGKASPYGPAPTPQPTGAPAAGGGAAGGAVSGSGFDFNAVLEQQRKLAASAYEEAKRRAQAGYDRAKGVFDEGLGLLGKRRGEFSDTYNQGNSDILTSYEGGRGELQAADQGAQTRLANILRAAGLGGSAALRGQGRLTQNNAKNLGTLNEARAGNERENLKGFNANTDWANTQESALYRTLADAAEAQRATENQAGLVEQGDLAGINERSGGYLDQILNNQLALQSMMGGINSKAVSPYSVNLPSLTGKLSSSVPTLSGNGSTTDQAVSLSPTQSYLDWLKQQSAGAGLYK